VGSQTDPRWLRGRAQSRDRHRAAQKRDPPVEIGDVETVAISEFTDHHSGERQAVGKIEGFVVFVEDVPGGCEPTDVIRIKVLSFNRGHTSATATFLETALKYQLKRFTHRSPMRYAPSKHERR